MEAFWTGFCATIGVVASLIAIVFVIGLVVWTGDEIAWRRDNRKNAASRFETGGLP